MELGVTERISVTSTGAQAVQRSDPGRITPNGRFVVFESDADLSPTDTNGVKDVYRLDRQSGQLDLVSITAAGVQGTGWSYHPDVSDDGQHIAFTSGNDNFVAGDTNGSLDIFLKDMTTGALTRVNTTGGGGQSASSTCTWPYISGDGGTVAFSSTASNLVTGDSNGDWDVFAKDIATGAIERLSVRPNGGQANDGTRTPMTVSTDGNLIIYASLATNIVAGDTNGRQDIFLRDRAAGTTERVNLALDGGELNSDSWVPAMSGDARYVTYTSEATNIVTGNTMNERQIFAIDRFDVPAIGAVYCQTNPNSTGVMSQISATGSLVAANNNVVLAASELPSFVFGFFITSRTQGFNMNPGGSMGNICVAGSVGRYVGPGEVQNSGANGEIILAIDLNAMPQPNGFEAAVAGDTWNFQAWHRDSVAGTVTSNFTGGLEIVFQ
jgi:Tol biopolymer transport system component